MNLFTRKTAERREIRRQNVQIGKRLIELRGQNSNHRVGAGIESQRRANYARVSAKAALPQSIAHQHHRFAALAIFVRQKIATEQGTDSQGLKEARGHSRGLKLLR